MQAQARSLGPLRNSKWIGLRNYNTLS
jgi:hypothetical protein